MLLLLIKNMILKNYYNKRRQFFKLTSKVIFSIFVAPYVFNFKNSSLLIKKDSEKIFWILNERD